MSTRKRIDDDVAYLDSYRAKGYPRPSVTADIVVFTVADAQLRVLLVKRKEPPFKGSWALPGGVVRVGDSAAEQGEDLDATAARALEEETGLVATRVRLEQLYTFGKAGRDPRLRVISVAYVALVRPDLAPLVQAHGDESTLAWFHVEQLKKMELAFDHREMVRLAQERIRAQLDCSQLAFDLVPLTFTIPELRQVHAILTGETQDPGNFRRRFNRMLEDGRIEKAPGKRITTSKPATVYRFRR